MRLATKSFFKLNIVVSIKVKTLMRSSDYRWMTTFFATVPSLLVATKK